jgi:hypothetical protein
VSIVFLVYNRRDQLRESLRRMLQESDYEQERVDVIVVDNASSDGSADMVRAEFPEVELIVRDTNVGVSGWNDGVAIARGDYVLMLDDDCYLPANGLRRAVAAAREHGADLVSFKVVSTEDPSDVFTDLYRTGLLSFWGCAVLVRRAVLDVVGGYDPRIFVWANELEFMLRFYDNGFRHLYFPEVEAQHMKAAREGGAPAYWRTYRFNSRHFAYIAAKLLHPRDALLAFVAVVTRNVLNGLAIHPRAFTVIPVAVLGFLEGLRRRDPVQHAEVSRCYRKNFEAFAGIRSISPPIDELIRLVPGELLRRPFRGKRRSLISGAIEDYFVQRARWYPDQAAVLGFGQAVEPS